MLLHKLLNEYIKFFFSKNRFGVEIDNPKVGITNSNMLSMICIEDLLDESTDKLDQKIAMLKAMKWHSNLVLAILARASNLAICEEPRSLTWNKIIQAKVPNKFKHRTKSI
jgi:hypothetical protein